MGKRLRVMLVEDHALVAEGFRALLAPEFDIVEVVNDPLAAVAAVRRVRPDVLVLDISMPGKSGLDIAREVLTDWPAAGVIMLTMHGQHSYVKQALALGVRGFVLKLADVENLKTAIREVAAGGKYISPESRSAAANPHPHLSRRQLEILRMIGQGLTTAEMAERLDINLKTAEYHRQNLRHVLGLPSHAAVLRYAIDNGLTE